MSYFKEVRKALRLSQSELAELLDYHQPNLSMIESGGRKAPSELVLKLNDEAVKSLKQLLSDVYDSGLMNKKQLRTMFNDFVKGL